ncbi:unnamed protein product, partial [Rangifer tarandus platyrhynchus]
KVGPGWTGAVPDGCRAIWPGLAWLGAPLARLPARPPGGWAHSRSRSLPLPSLHAAPLWSAAASSHGRNA